MRKLFNRIKAARLFVAFIALLVVSCSYDDNEKKAIEWIDDAKKPIICNKGFVNAWTFAIKYTLISADGKIYQTGYVDLALPDTLNGYMIVSTDELKLPKLGKIPPVINSKTIGLDSLGTNN